MKRAVFVSAPLFLLPKKGFSEKMFCIHSCGMNFLGETSSLAVVYHGQGSCKECLTFMFMKVM